MKYRICATFLLSFVLFGLPKAYADDVSEGKNIFIAKCIGCHAFTCNKDGPRLGGLFGRKVAGVEDYKFYSQGFKNSEIIWTDKTLDKFFTEPRKIFPESGMATKGFEDAAQRRKLLAFLKTEDPTVNLCPQE